MNLSPSNFYNYAKTLKGIIFHISSEEIINVQQKLEKIYQTANTGPGIHENKFFFSSQHAQAVYVLSI
jgi:hypothetical protein